jgi:hypothetical protein
MKDPEALQGSSLQRWLAQVASVESSRMHIMGGLQTAALGHYFKLAEGKTRSNERTKVRSRLKPAPRIIVDICDALHWHLDTLRC